MNLKANYNRFALLFMVLVYSTKKGEFFNTGERIIINQERAKQLSNINTFEIVENPINEKKTKFSRQLKNKIKFVITKIENDPEVLEQILIQISESVDVNIKL